MQYLFTDGSVNTKTKIGCGACLCLGNIDVSLQEMEGQVQFVSFEETSSTRLELQTLLWALENVIDPGESVTVYTDSQNIIGLLGRKEKLLRNDFKSGKGKLLNNADLYKIFYEKVGSLEMDFLKVKGHMPAREKDRLHQVFTIVDRASRRRLRESGAYNP